MSYLRSITTLVAGLTLALAAHATPKVVKRVLPDFPREASQKGISTGVVKVKLSIEADGSVSEVEIVEAEPKRLFDRAAKTALMEWKFEPGEKATHEVRLVFKNDD